MYTIKKPTVTVYSQINNNFDWGLYSDAERFLKREVQKFLRQIPFANKLAKKIEGNTSTCFLDWIDHIVIPGNKIDITKLKYSGLEVKKNGLERHGRTGDKFYLSNLLKRDKRFPSQWLYFGIFWMLFVYGGYKLLYQMPGM